MRRWNILLLSAALILGSLFVAGPAAARPSAGAHVDAAVTQLVRGGSGDVFVMLKDQADLRGAQRLSRHADRVAAAYQALRDTATGSQAGVRALLAGSGRRYTSFWLVNTILVRGADAALVARLAARPEVARIRAAGRVTIQPTQRVSGTDAAAAADPAGVEWGISRVRAPEVWSQLGARGDGIVVATIDTGVQYDHPALYRQYRGYKPDGTYDHNYNWYDPAGVCAQPAGTPCDNVGHGTHTMGTIVGSDGASNQIGMAPGARWISAKGCEDTSCSDYALLSAGQWILAPTDLSGANPRPDLAPNIVSNSWGGGSDPFYAGIVNAWVQAGIFPVFASGNSGPSCGSAGSPGDYANAYSVGAFDSSNQIAGFSGRGASNMDGGIKPNISAPGVAVRSSVPGSGYDTYSGTSMATPHVAGAVALLWSAAPALIGDITGTRDLLDNSAVDVEDLSCGGTADDNNVWGEGRLDAYSAVALSPTGPTGVLTGTVTDSHAAPIPGTIVRISGNDAQRSATTDANGAFSVVLPVGQYQFTASAFGYVDFSTAITIVEAQSFVQNVQLTSQPRYSIFGVLRQPGGAPLPGVQVSVPGTPLAATVTASDGSFGIGGVPPGTYRLATLPARCAGALSTQVSVTKDVTVTLDAPPRADGFGYKCEVTTGGYVDGTTVLGLTGDDAATTVPLPFPMSLYGHSYTTAFVSTNGFLNFDRSTWLSINSPLPNSGLPDAAVYPFWDDLVVDASASVRTALVGTAPNRRFVVEWNNVRLYDVPTARMTFEAILDEDGQIFLAYKTLSTGTLPRGGSATIGIEDGAGLTGFEYSYNTATLRNNMSIRLHGLGIIQGVVSDVDGRTLSGVPVQLGSSTAVTDASGIYRFFTAVGNYQVSVSQATYAFAYAKVTIANEGDVVTANLRLLKQYNTLSGHIYDDTGKPMAGVNVTAFTWAYPYSAVTDANGAYRIDNVPPVTVNFAIFNTPCSYYQDGNVVVERDMVTDYTVRRKSDSFGYRCFTPDPTYQPGTTTLPLTGDDEVATVPLPFSFPFYGKSYSTAYVSTNGLLNFLAPVTSTWLLQPPPSFLDPNAAVYAYATDLMVDSAASVRTATVGSGASAQFVIEWQNVLVVGTQLRMTFEVVLCADGRILLNYTGLPADGLARGSNAGVAIEDDRGSTALQVSWIEALLSTNQSVELRPPA